MKRLKSYFFTNTNLNSRGKYISLKDNAEPNETLFSDMLDSVVKPKVGTNYQDQADHTAINTKDSTKFTTAENLPEVDTIGSLLTITTTVAVDTNLLRRKKYTVVANIPTIIDDVYPTRVATKLVTPANLPKFALDNSDYVTVNGQIPYYTASVVVTVDEVNMFQTYNLKLRALESIMMTHDSVRLDSVLNTLRADVNAKVSDAELASAVSTLNTAIGLKANKVTPTFVTGYNGTKVVVNSQGIVTSVSKASALDIANDSSVSGSTVKDALNWLKTNGGGGTGGASDTDGITNLSNVAGATATDAFNTLLAATQQTTVRDFVVINSGGTILENKVNAIIVSADTSFTLPTASSSNYGKSIVIVNRSTYTVTINGIVNGTSIKLTNFNETIQLSCLFDGVSTYGWWLISDAITDKICSNKVDLVSSTYIANHNDNINAIAQTAGSDINITIPTASIDGRLIYVTYKSLGPPSSYVVNIIGGFTATLIQGDYFLLRDNGSYWDAISTSQNVAVTPDLATVTTAGNTTTNDITVGSVTASNTTVSTLPFIDGAKKIITATGALFGTWLNGLTAKSTVVDADTIVVNDSASSFEAKKTTMTELWTNYLLSKVQSLGYLTGSGLITDFVSKWDGTKYVNSKLKDTATGFISTGITGGFDLQGLSGKRIFLDLATPQIYVAGVGQNIILADSSGTTKVLFLTASNSASIYASVASFGVGISPTHRTIYDTSVNQIEVIAGTNGTISWNTSGGVQVAKLNTSGLALGSSTINGLTQLELQASNKGLGLNQVAGDLGTGRNGLIWYDTAGNNIKGIVNGNVTSLMTAPSSPINNYFPKWNSSTGTYVMSTTYDDGNYIYATGNGFRTLTALNVALQLETTGASATSSIFLKSAGQRAIVAFNNSSQTQWQIFDLGGQMYIESQQTTGLTIQSVGGTGSHYISIRNGGNTYYNNATHTFLNASGTQIGELSISGLSLGSSTINASAQLELQSTTKGFLPPRMTTAQKNLISQVEGLVVYDTDLDSLCQNNGTVWSTLGGSVSTVNVSTKTANYTITSTNDIILADATSGVITITLPTAVGVTKLYKIKRINTNSNVVTVDTTSSQTMDGSTTLNLVAYQSLEFVSDGANWFIV